MQTRCPHCLTLFEIQQEQLEAASGQARCSYCDNIFNARKNLLDPPTPVDSAAGEQRRQEEESAFSLNTLFDESELGSDNFPEFEQRPPQPREPESNPIDNLASRFEATAIEGGNAQSEEAGIELSEDDFERQTQATSADLSDELLPFQLDNGRVQKPAHRGHPYLWSTAILLMIALALGQLAWFARGSLQKYPEIRELLELACGHLECTLPPWHEPKRFQIISRTVESHPASDQALKIHLEFTNQARFAQSYPFLQLSLYDLNETLSARRSFQPREYLNREPLESELLIPGQSVKVDMILRDPGREITAFVIDFH